MHARASNGIIPLGGSAVIRQTGSTSCFGLRHRGHQPEVNGQMLRMGADHHAHGRRKPAISGRLFFR